MKKAILKKGEACHRKKKTNIAAAFLEKDYELKINYLKEHFDRMWTRFNYFIGFETVITGGGIIWGGKDISVALLAWSGALISFLWYMMGAQDRYLAEYYREQANAAGLRRRRVNSIPQLAYRA